MEKIEDLRHLVKSYSEPDTMQRFMATAKATPEQTLVQLKAYDVIQSGDSMTIWLDMISKKQRRVEIQTSMNEKPVKIISEFQDIGGFKRGARAWLCSPPGRGVGQRS